MSLGFDKTETEKLAREVEKLGIIMENKEGTILWHGRIKHNLPKEYRDKNRARISVLFDHASVSIEAGICPFGIGDGQKPNIALTYSIGFCIHANKIDFNCSREGSTELNKFYKYSRSLPELIELFKKHLETL